MSDLNNVQLFGRVVRDAELKKTANNLDVAVFSIATNHSIKKADGTWENKADFFPLAIYGNYAERLAPRLVKGQKLIIEGFAKQNRWEKDGVKHSEIGIGVRSIQLIFDSKAKDNVVKDTEDVTSVKDEENYEFTEEQLAEMYTSEAERLSGNSDEEIF